MSRFADVILHLHGWLALVVVFAVPALESSAFLGFLFPGEIAVLLGGVLAFQHKVSLAGALAAAIAGAVVGDSVGFEVGKRWGRRLLHGTVGRVINTDHLDRAERYLAERGGKAVFFGRFTAALRVLIPGMAGMSGMPYRTFATYNVVGGTLWAGGFVIVGYVAGNGYKRFESVAKQASLLLLLFVVGLVAVVVATRFVIGHRDRVETFARRQLGRPPVVRVRNRYQRQLAFLSRRFRPGGAQGLALTGAFVALVLAGWAFGIVVSEVVRQGGLVGTDQPILDFFVRHRTPGVTSAMKVAAGFGSAWVLAPCGLLIGLGFRRWRQTWRPLVLLLAGVLGAVALQAGVGALVGRGRPPLVLASARYSGASYPAGSVAQATAFWGALALVWSSAASEWSGRVVAWSVSIVIAASVGVAECYLGMGWASDVVGGWFGGAVWLLAVAVIGAATTAGLTGGAPSSGKGSVRAR